MSGEQPTEEELRAALEEQMRHIRVEDVIIQTVVTLVNLAGRRLGLAGPAAEEGPVDLAQARQAIEGARALVPLLPADQGGPVRDALSQLQIAYAREAGGTGPAAPGAAAETGGAPGQDPAAPGPSAQEAQERAKARAKLWTPPGT